MKMKFEKIESTTACKCLNDTHIDVVNTYARRIGKTKEPKARDFKTHYERGKLLKEDLEDCGKVCGSHGVSVDLWTDESKSEVLEKYLITYRIAPKHRNNVSIIQFTNTSGRLKHTPIERDPINLHHHDFYKSDEFDVEQSLVLLDLLEIKEQ